MARYRNERIVKFSNWVEMKLRESNIVVRGILMFFFNSIRAE